MPFKALAAPTLPLDQIFLYPKPHCRRRRLTQGARAGWRAARIFGGCQCTRGVLGCAWIAGSSARRNGRLTLFIRKCGAGAITDRIVRGEDSFARAQWAQRPLVWQLYPQRGGTHHAKLDATLAAYAADLSVPAR